MKKEKTASSSEVKDGVQPAEVSHLKNGHKWLAWVTGLTAAWTLVTFILALIGECDLPQSLKYLNVWYIVNMGIITLVGIYATVCILKKCRSLIFWGGALMYILLLQSVSLVILYFFNQDVAAINAVVFFVWSLCWYGYMVTSPAVEADLPSAHRGHHVFGNVVVAVMTVSTVAYAFMMVFKLLW